MSEHDDRLRELGSQLPWDRPDEARREAVRASLLVAATSGADRPATRWYVIGGAFAAGALAAAAAILIVLRGGHGPDRAVDETAQIEGTTAADFERHVTHTATGVDEVVRVHRGTISLAVGAIHAGDRVRVATNDAEVEGEGSYDVAVADDRIREVTVKLGRVAIRVEGQQAVFLSAGETWKAKLIVADLTPPPVGSGDGTTATGTPTTTAPDSAGATGVAGTTSAAGTSGGAPPGAATPGAGATTAPRDTTPGGSTTGASGTSGAAVATRAATTSRVTTGVTTGPRDTTTGGSTTAASGTAGAEVAARAGAGTTGAATAGAATAGTPPTALPAVTSLTPDAPSAGIGSDAPPKVTAPTIEVEKRFAAGWQLLKANKPAEAARELGAAADAGGDNPLAADARYFQAIALTKAGRKTEAETAFVAFLDRAPHSIRRGRASVMLARLIAERGDPKAARAWFEAALRDGDAGVAAAARTGLAALPH